MKRFNEYSKQKKEILKQLGKQEESIDNYYQVAMDIHDLAYRAKDLYLSKKAGPDDKRIILNKVFMSLWLEDKKIIVEYNPAYKLLAEWMPKLNATS